MPPSAWSAKLLSRSVVRATLGNDATTINKLYPSPHRGKIDGDTWALITLAAMAVIDAAPAQASPPTSN